MDLNKRGMFFVLLTIVVLSLFLISIGFLSGYSERRSVQDRVESLDEFVFAIEQDLPRKLYTTGFRTIFLIESEIVESGNAVGNVSEVVDEAFFDGTFNGEEKDILLGARFVDIEEFVEEKAGRIGAHVNFSEPRLSVGQEDPWHVKVTFVSEFLVEDEGNLAMWNKTLVVESYVPITNFSDPLYLLSTNGMASNQIVKSPYTDFVSGSDTSNLRDHLINSYYIASVSAPSFIDRLEGRDEADVNGVESLVNLNKLSNQGVLTKEKSVVDYIYFSSSSPSYCAVAEPGLPSWFRIDNGHLAIYEISCG